MREFSGSSMLDLKEGGADLSRRVIEYHLPAWSFREYLNLRNGWSLKSVPVKINYSDMARDLELDRDELPKYLEYLEKAELVSVLLMKAYGDAILRKMDKLYLHNSNMAYVLSGEQPNKGKETD